MGRKRKVGRVVGAPEGDGGGLDGGGDGPTLKEKATDAKGKVQKDMGGEKTAVRGERKAKWKAKKIKLSFGDGDGD